MLVNVLFILSLGSKYIIYILIPSTAFNETIYYVSILFYNTQIT